MSTAVANSRIDRVARFYDSTIGKKAVMAVTGLILFGYLIVHMLGNLQFFLGPEVMNRYAEMLHGNPPLLWGVRVLLLVSVILHAGASIQLWKLKQIARPVAYVKPGRVQATFASRTMMLSGPIIGAFVVYHLLHMTTGDAHPQFVPLRPFENLLTAFRNPIVSAVYVASMIFVGFHLSHGAWSMFQSVGFNHPRYTPFLKKSAAIVAWILIAGFISIPIAVITGVVG